MASSKSAICWFASGPAWITPASLIRMSMGPKRARARAMGSSAALVGRVGGEGGHLRAARPQVLLRLAQVRAVARDQRQARAFPGERPRDEQAQAARPAGDDDDLALER